MYVWLNRAKENIWILKVQVVQNIFLRWKMNRWYSWIHLFLFLHFLFLYFYLSIFCFIYLFFGIQESSLLYCLSISLRRDGFMPFARVLAQSEMQIAPSRIWTWITNFILHDNCYVKHVLLILCLTTIISSYVCHKNISLHSFSGTVGWDCRIRRLHLCRRVKFLVSWVRH